MQREARLRVALVLNVVVVAGQVVAGLVAHSLGLLADAGHNVTDVAALVLAIVAVRLTRRAPTERRSFGYHRSGILAAQANAALLLAATGVIGWEAVRRLLHPQDVRGGVVVVAAAVAMVANAVAALALAGQQHTHAGHDHGHAHEGDLNMRAALLHMVADAAASAGVLVAGLVILTTGRFEALDPLVSLAIGIVVAWRAVQLLRETADVLLESTPAGLDVGQLADAIRAVAGVDEVHDLHVWSLSSDMRALSAHVVLSGHPSLEEAQVVGERIKAVIGPRFAIAHATLELECEPCAEPNCDPASLADAAVARPH